MTRRNFELQKENDCKVELRFVNCCTFVVTKVCHILIYRLNRLVPCHFIMSRMYIIKPAGSIISGNAIVTRVNGDGRFEPLSRGFRWQSPLRKFLGPKKYLDWLKIDLDVAKN